MKVIQLLSVGVLAFVANVALANDTSEQLLMGKWQCQSRIDTGGVVMVSNSSEEYLPNHTTTSQSNIQFQLGDMVANYSVDSSARWQLMGNELTVLDYTATKVDVDNPEFEAMLGFKNSLNDSSAVTAKILDLSANALVLQLPQGQTRYYCYR